jgi:hypothetical protein
MKRFQMKKLIYLTLISGFALISCRQITEKVDPLSFVPPIENVAGEWVSADTIAMEPSLRNFRAQALVNRDITSISWLAAAPYSGGYHTGVMKINGQVPMVNAFRWQPWQALRKSEITDFEVLSSTRMIFEQNAILWRVKITNKTSKTQPLNIDLDLIGFISKYGGDWQWWYPYPKMEGKVTKRDDEVETVRKFIGKEYFGQEVMVEEMIEVKLTGKMKPIKFPTDNDILTCKKYHSEVENGNLFVYDNETEAVIAFAVPENPESLIALNSGGSASWKYELKPGETKTFEYCMAFGDNKENVSNELDDFSGNFGKWFEGVKTDWEKKWAQLFTPDKSLVSGCFPILETDDELVKKVYYTGPLTMLYLLNTNLPEHERVFLTGGPRWGASTTFFWDIAIWSELWAVVDPMMMKEQIIAWIKIDPNKFYGQDNFGGKGVGNGYSANYWCLYKIIRDYVVATGDYDFLDEIVGERSVLDHIEGYALNWKNLSLYGTPGHEDEIYQLADFGSNPWNLLECVPTYIHIVPSFNIGYVWMMRETANFYKKKENFNRADSLDIQAEKMVKNILKLYAGNGVWNSLYPNNKKVEVRHVLDLIYFGKFLADDVSPSIKQEMMEFLNRELMTDSWMRAQSLSDIAAKDSDRPDHGPMGSFDGWIPEVMDAITQMGYPQEALDFYKAIEPVTHEGCWSQARELWGENKLKKSASVRIASRGWNNRESSSGIGISQVMLKNFFGFYPQINGKVIEDKDIWPFKGKSKLHHVYYNNEYYTIEFQNDKPVIVKESTELN